MALPNPTITALDWQSAGACERIVASMTFDNIDQSCRFIGMITAFVLKEREYAKASQPPQATAGQHEAPQQGEVQGKPQTSSGTDGQHSIETDTGSVT